MPVKLVRLDTIADRRAVSQGKFFQIHSVPTLLVTYEDGNIQLFVGQEKILEWLQRALNALKNQNIPQTPIESEEEEVVPRHRKPRPKKTSKKPTKGLYGGKSKTKKKPPPVQLISDPEDSENEEVEIEFLDDERPSRLPPPPTGGLVVGPAATMKNTGKNSIMDLAKQMEKQRDSTLGYREEDLPVGT